MRHIVAASLIAAALAAGVSLAADKQPTRVYAPFHKIEYPKDQQLKIAALQAEYRAKIKALEEEMNQKVLAMLTDEQKAEFARQQEEQAKKRREYSKKPST